MGVFLKEPFTFPGGRGGECFEPVFIYYSNEQIITIEGATDPAISIALPFYEISNTAVTSLTPFEYTSDQQEHLFLVGHVEMQLPWPETPFVVHGIAVQVNGADLQYIQEFSNTHGPYRRPTPNALPNPATPANTQRPMVNGLAYLRQGDLLSFRINAYNIEPTDNTIIITRAVLGAYRCKSRTMQHFFSLIDKPR